MTTITTHTTRLGLDRASWVLLAGGGAVLGGGLGLVLDPLTTWATGLRWLPAPDLVRVLNELAIATPTWAQILAGLVLGVVAGVLLGRQATVVEVTADEIVVVEGSRRQRLARSQVGAAVLDRGRLSVRDHRDVDLVDVKVDVDVDELRRALRAHDWQVRG